jgi:hypothetical protein
MLAGMAGSRYSADERHPMRPSIHAECDHGRGRGVGFHVDHPGSVPNLASPATGGSLCTTPCCSVCAGRYVEPSEQVHEELLEHGAGAFTV